MGVLYHSLCELIWQIAITIANLATKSRLSSTAIKANLANTKHLQNFATQGILEIYILYYILLNNPSDPGGSEIT